MRLRLLSRYGAAAPSSRTRLLAWLPRLGAGVEVAAYDCFGGLGPRAPRLRRAAALARAEVLLRRLVADPVDVAVIAKQLSPLSRGAVEERLLRAAGRAVVDVDDGVPWDWRPGPRGAVLRPDAFTRSVLAADVVVAGNEMLATWAATAAPEVVVIPTCVEPTDYAVTGTGELGDPPRLGWIGSPSTEPYLRTIERPLLDLHRRTGAVLVVISAGAASLGPLDRMVRRQAWSPGTAAALASTVDAGIMPLDDSLWARGKCAYKLLQYGAAGLPAAASPWGANAEVAGALGYPTPRTPAEWHDVLLEALTTDAATRRSRGRRARLAVTRQYSYDAWFPVWHEAVLGSPARPPAVSDPDPVVVVTDAGAGRAGPAPGTPVSTGS